MAIVEGCRVWVAGRRGPVGGAPVRRPAGDGCALLLAGRDRRAVDAGIELCAAFEAGHGGGANAHGPGHDFDLASGPALVREIHGADLAGLVAEVVGFEGAFAFDGSKPDGTPPRGDVARARDRHRSRAR